ncbi:hypothetical protein PGT21_020029 [Puccinia graminis f. sp. tritici]|uniref:JmjC domain-containing protein n=1 Tax=Puccinia graminis f. sp. tritici TaxID=56615 RepID=A0A5B0NYT4_PUCGR|nr:hypothetical protein PGTUg99_008787 [Puccinia graminis f. sp. tritici]KAA1094391.1 hypothetical protein PGT21_020029 [Puccinia graminis f. sp. tritici]
MDVLAEDPSYSTFLQSYLLPNRPVLIRSKLASEWPASILWTTPVRQELSRAEDRREDLTGLVRSYGHLEVPVVKQRIQSSSSDFLDDLESFPDWGKRITSQENDCMPFSQVAAYWEKKLRDPTRPNHQEGQAVLNDEEVIYVKDWHLIRICQQTNGPENLDEERHSERRNATPFYQVPEIFLDDWMNDYYSAETDDDFRFVYIGEKGTTTGLHTDVYNSYSWSANIVGKKKWRLFRPESDESITIEQSPGEIIFVPSGWKHEVLNLSPLVISINHNWCNSVNLPSVYDALAKDIEDVKESIADVKALLRKKWDNQLAESSVDPTSSGWEHEWIEVVQELTKQHSGWNWATFWGMVKFITRRDFTEASTSSLFDQLVPQHSPPLQFVKTQINLCVMKFKMRDEFNFDAKLRLIIQDIESCLSRLK